MADFIDNNCVESSSNDCSAANIESMQNQQNVEVNPTFVCEKDDTVCLLIPKGQKTSTKNDSQSRKEKRQLIMATSLCFVFMLAEIVGGYLAGSLAIMSDAAHLLSDCISFIVALLAICLSKKIPDNYMTFGYKRVEVLGAILSIFGIWLLTTFLLYFAINRLLYQDFDIDADTMMLVSLIGIIINIIMAIILHGDGLCCTSHTHSHSGKHEHHYHNNNKSKMEYKPLISESSSERRNKSLSISSIPASFLIGTRNSLAERNNSVCSHRSPSQSRSNSFSRSIPLNAEMIRRSSSSKLNISNGRLKDSTSIDCAQRDTIDIDLNDDKLTISKDIVYGCITDGTAICPIHNYVHRDSSENTSISSDSEDHHHHQHNHLLHNNSSHHNHSHDFSSKNINIQAAVIHVIGDFIQSIGVFVSAVIIKFYPNAKIADPLCTFAFSIIVMMTTCTIMKDSIGILLEAVPNSINTERLTEDLKSIEGVRSVHNLNIWSLTVGHNLMSVHIITDPYVSVNDVLYIGTTIAKNGYNIKHCTIQVESMSTHPDGIAEQLLNGKKHSIVTENSNSIINMIA